jgi:hypothetical protein
MATTEKTARILDSGRYVFGLPVDGTPRPSSVLVRGSQKFSNNWYLHLNFAATLVSHASFL